MSNVRWLSVSAWRDPDGEHVWIAHDCLDGRRQTMLPNDKWRADADGKTASPSFHCLICDCHTGSPFDLGPPPAEFAQDSRK